MVGGGAQLEPVSHAQSVSPFAERERKSSSSSSLSLSFSFLIWFHHDSLQGSALKCDRGCEISAGVLYVPGLRLSTRSMVYKKHLKIPHRLFLNFS